MEQPREHIPQCEKTHELDPWKNRSEGMRCKSCIWFVRKGHGEVLGDSRGRIGRCRRHAPTMSGYPVVFEGDWCGDHRLDESKI